MKTHTRVVHVGRKDLKFSGERGRGKRERAAKVECVRCVGTIQKQERMEFCIQLAGRYGVRTTVQARQALISPLPHTHCFSIRVVPAEREKCQGEERERESQN